jgi:enoyl-CoA hydratase/carnithine racemase
MNDLLEVTREGRLLRIALNRPDKRNALSVELCRQLVITVDHAAADSHTGAILLTGNGPAFCAGMDLNEILSADVKEINRVQEQLFSLATRLTTPVIAAVHGAALAAGTGLVANCHLAIASEDATFGLTEIRIGLWPFLIYRSVAIAVGERRATELALTGRILTARQALDYGLVGAVCPAGELAARAAEIATRLAYASPTAVRSGLMFVQEIRRRDDHQTAEIARSIRGQILRAEDFREGVHAFQEKREPRWPSLVPSERENGKN